MFSKIVSALLLCCLPLLLPAEQTLSLIKPDAVVAGHIGEILSRFESKGLRITALKITQLSKEQAIQFYAAHQERSFFCELVNYMSSGPLVAIVLEGDHAIQKNRDLMGDTDPLKATPGTLRRDFGTSKGENAVHGSDTPDAARLEIAFFFKSDEIVNLKR